MTFDFFYFFFLLKLKILKKDAKYINNKSLIEILWKDLRDTIFLIFFLLKGKISHSTFHAEKINFNSSKTQKKEIILEL